MLKKVSLKAHDASLYDIHKDIFSLLVKGEEGALDGMVSQLADYFRKIILCMPGNVYWVDKDCRTVGCNQNVLDMFGLESLDDFYGLSFADLARIGRWDEGQAESFKRDTFEVIKTGEVKADVEEPPIPGVDGQDVYFLTTRVPLFNAQDEVIGIVGISTDITELKIAKQALEVAKEEAEAANNAKSEFLANMSHDVKTPLSGLIGGAELLTVKLENKQLQEFAQDMLSSGEKLLEFFDNTLELSRLEMSGVNLIPRSFDLSGVIQDLVLLFKPLLTTKNIHLTVDYDDRIPGVVLGGQSHVYRVIQNLVGNAIKFTPEGGAIIIRAELDKLATSKEVIVNITVEDTGMGIPHDKFDVIFEKMSRLTSSYSSVHEGYGMGLYIVDKFVKAMGGKISVKSEEGKGSQFTVMLPFELAKTKELPV